MSVKLYILTDEGHKELELDSKENVILNFALKDWNTIGGDSNNRDTFSLAINANWTRKNCKTFGIPYNLSVNSNKLFRGQKYTAFIEKGASTYKGIIVSLIATKENNVRKIQFQFLGQYANWASSLQGCNLCDLRFGEFVSSRAEVENLMADDGIYDGTNPVYYGLIWSGEPKPVTFPPTTTTPDYIVLTEQRPQVAAKAVIEAIQQKTGIPIESQFFKTDYFRNKWYAHGRKDIFFEGLTSTLNTTIAAGGSGAVEFNFILDDWTLFDGAGFVNPTSGIMKLNSLFDDSEVTVKLAIDVNIVTGTPYIFFTDLSNSYVGGAALQNGLNEIEFTATIPSDNPIAIQIVGGTVDLLAGSFVSFCMETTRWVENVKTWASSVLPCKPINDYIGGLTDSYNLVWFYDIENEKLIVEPKFPTTLPTGEVIKGFYKYEINSNLNPVFDCANDEINFFVSSEYKRTFIQRFKSDSNDKFVVEEENSTDYLHASKLELSEKFDTGETEIENRCFAPTDTDLLPTPYGVTGGNGQPLVPFMINYDPNDDNPTRTAKYNFELRELCKCGTTAGDWNWYSSGNTLTTYPKLTQVDTDCGINAGYSDIGNLQGKTSLFFSKDIDIYNNSIIVTIDSFLECPKIEFEDLFRTLLWVETNCGIRGKYIVEEMQINLNKDKALFRLIAYDY